MLILIILTLVPPSPDLKKKLIQEGKWEGVKQILIDARERGVDEPDTEALEKTRERMLQKQSDTLLVPVILTEFTDNQAQTPDSHYTDMLFSESTYPTGSLKDYYLENSYGNFYIDGWVSIWLMMPQPYSYYTDGQYGFGSFPRNAQGLARDAVLSADPYVDFSQFDKDNDGYVDAIFIVHAGPGAEETGNPNHIWSHAWYIPGGVNVDGVIVYYYSMEPENGKIGVFGHELGHTLGLPDLYDTDYSSEGLGNWSMMAGGSWGGGGVKPVHFDVWCKYKLGFLAPVNVTSIIENASFLPVEDFPVAYRLWTSGNASPQYFLAELRRRKGFDVSLPGEGILLFHIDENQSSNRNEWYPGYTNFGHYKVALEQADGLWQLEQNMSSGDPGDPYPGTTDNRNFDDYSTPDSKDYNFSTTYVSVTGISNFGDTIFADLAVVPVYNLSVDELVVPPVLQRDSSFTPRVFFSNRGFYSQNFDLTLRIDSAGTTLYEEISSFSLSPGQKDSIDFLPFTVHSDDWLYNAIAFVSGQDQMHRNDTLEANIFSYTLKRFLSSPYTSNLPVIDGVIQSSEWSDAFVLDASDFLAQDNKRNVKEATVYFKNSNNTFYIGAILDDTSSGTDFLRVFVDDDGDGSFPAYPNSSEGELRLQETGSGFTLYYKPYYSTGQGGYQVVSLPFGTGFTSGKRSYELAIPVVHRNYALDEEIGVSTETDTFGAHFRARDGSASDVKLYWLQDIPFSSYADPSLYGKIEVTGISLSIKEWNISISFNFNLLLIKKGYKLSLYFPEKSDFDILFYNVLGRKVWERRVENANFYNEVLNTKIYPAGVYFLYLKSRYGTFVKKLLFY